MFKKNIGQSTLEYAVLIVVIVAALMAIKIYMGRGVQGKLRESTDQIGEQYSAGKTTYKIATQQTTQQITKETFGLAADGATRAQGVSSYTVQTPGSTTRKTETAEKTAVVADENLFE